MVLRESRPFEPGCFTFVTFVAILALTQAKCIPTERRDAPGVGIDLTMAYGAVAIHYKNGTTRDLGPVDGSPGYLAAMQSMAEDAGEYRLPIPLPQEASRCSSTCTNSAPREPGHEQLHKPIRTFYPHPIIMDWWWSLKAWCTDTFERLGLSAPIANEDDPPDLYWDDIWIEATADMLSKIKSTILDKVDPPLKYNDVVTIWPDFEADTYSIYSGLFRQACTPAGLRHLGGYIASYSSLLYDGVQVDDYYDWGEEECEPSAPYAMLVVSYNAASLGITMNTRQFGRPWPERLVESPQHGANQRNGSEEYWDEVKGMLESVIQCEVVDHLLLLGSHAYDTDLIQSINEVIERHANIKSSILDRYNSSRSETARDGNLPLFTAARRAAVIAQRRMERGFSEDPVYCDEHEKDTVRKNSHSEL